MVYNPHDSEYHSLLHDTLHYGESRPDRTGTGTLGLFGSLMTFQLKESFPLITTKYVHWKSVVHELLWIMSGDTNVKYLNNNGVTIWDEWAREDGELGPVYGAQWRSWKGAVSSVDFDVDGASIVVSHEYHDQLQALVDGLKSDPFGRRHVISAWNVADVKDMALPPCHCLFQFWVSAEDNSLHCQLYQRSADVFLGVPFNVASYALLTCILADTLGFERGSLSWVGGDVHLYQNHVDQAKEQLTRRPFAPPTLKKISGEDPLSVRFEDVVLEDYQHHPGIKAPVSV